MQSRKLGPGSREVVASRKVATPDVCPRVAPTTIANSPPRGPFEGARALVGLVERAARLTPALADHGSRTALGCRCRGADCASRSSIIPTNAPVRSAGASEPDNNMVHALVGGRGPAAAGRHRGCGAETRVRALARCRAGVPHPAQVAGSRGHGTAAVVRCGTGLTERARCFPPLSGFSRAASPQSRA